MDKTYWDRRYYDFYRVFVQCQSLELMLTKYNMFIHYFQGHVTLKALKHTGTWGWDQWRIYRCLAALGYLLAVASLLQVWFTHGLVKDTCTLIMKHLAKQETEKDYLIRSNTVLTQTCCCLAWWRQCFALLCLKASVSGTIPNCICIGHFSVERACMEPSTKVRHDWINVGKCKRYTCCTKE